MLRLSLLHVGNKQKMEMNTLNPSIKHHLLVGIFIGLWGFVFAFFVRPFDDGSIGLTGWIRISVGFNFIAFLVYGCLSVVQKYIYDKTKKWSFSYEIGAIVFYQVLYTIGTFIFYKSPLLNGNYTFFEFNTIITLRVALVALPVVVIARRYLIKLIPIKEDIVTIKGENKLDILKIKKSELICISNAQNYVEIFYLKNNVLHSKLIRSSLKALQEDLDFLFQVHRSHLINPSHFKSWKDQNTIYLTEIELPVSKSYKKQLLSL